MRVLRWNCQGVGNIPTVRPLREIHCQYFPETKNGGKYLEGGMEYLGYVNLHTVEPVGRSGGLALMWKDSLSIKILYSDKRLIDVEVTCQDKVFFLIFVYGDPVKENRSKLWERLVRIGVNRDGPWMLTWDFNEMIDRSEKKSRVIRAETSFVEFKKTLRLCGVWDVRHTCNPLSWYGWRSEELVECRLDRTVANQKRSEMLPSSQAMYLMRYGSDHSPLITNCLGERWRQWANFKFDHMWIHREGFKELVSNHWRTTSENGSRTVMGRIASCRKIISRWKRTARPNS